MEDIINLSNNKSQFDVKLIYQFYKKNKNERKYLKNQYIEDIKKIIPNIKISKYYSIKKINEIIYNFIISSNNITIYIDKNNITKKK